MDIEQYGSKTNALMEFLEKNGPLRISELTGIPGLPVKIDAVLQRLVLAGVVIEGSALSLRSQGRRFVKTYGAAEGWRDLKQESQVANRNAANATRQVRQKVGRPKAAETKPVTIRLTEVQRVHFLEMGGARWVKQWINESMHP